MGRHQAAEPKFTFICSPDELLGVLRADAGAKELRCKLNHCWNNEMFVELAEALRDNSYLQSFVLVLCGTDLGNQQVMAMACLHRLTLREPCLSVSRWWRWQ